MITLYQFPGVWGLPNASPFCMKLETYLRMVELPFELKFVRDPRKAPKGKFPFIKIDGKTIADTEIIINYLKAKFGDVLDKNLSKEQKALSVILDNTFTERLYWIILYTRWQHEPNWGTVKNAFFDKLPVFAKLFVPTLIRRSVIKALHSQGTGRHSYDEILEMAYKTLDAIAALLAEKKYFHGNEPSSIDAVAFGFLANIVWQPHEDALKTQLHKHKNVLSFCDRMWNNFYPELPKPFAIVD